MYVCVDCKLLPQTPASRRVSCLKIWNVDVETIHFCQRDYLWFFLRNDKSLSMNETSSMVKKKDSSIERFHVQYCILDYLVTSPWCLCLRHVPQGSVEHLSIGLDGIELLFSMFILKYCPVSD